MMRSRASSDWRRRLRASLGSFGLSVMGRLLVEQLESQAPAAIVRGPGQGLLHRAVHARGELAATVIDEVLLASRPITRHKDPVDHEGGFPILQACVAFPAFQVRALRTL